MKPSSQLKTSSAARTLKQAVFVWLLSNLPLICAALWQWWANYDLPTTDSFFGFLGKNLAAGEAFLYVASFVAPFFWTLTSYNEASKRVPSLMVPLIAAVIALAGSAFFFAVYRVGAASGVKQIPVVGSLLYIAGLFVWFKSMHDDSVLPNLKDPTMTSRARVDGIRDSLG